MGLLNRIREALTFRPVEGDGSNGGNLHSFEQWYVYPTTTWTAKSVRNAIDSLERGEFDEAGRLADSLLRDDRLAACLNTRTQSVQGLPFELQGDDPELAELWPVIFPNEVQSEVVRWVALMGFCVAQIRWTDPEGNVDWIPRIQPWHPSMVRWDPVRRRFIAFTTEGPQVVEPGGGKWVVFTGQDATRPWMSALVRALGQLLIIRQSNLVNWARNGQIHGNPPRVLTSERSMSEMQDVQAAAKALQRLVGESVIALPKGLELALLELKTNSWEVFAKLLTAVEEAEAILILGQNLTTRIAGGSHAAARVHDRIRVDYLEADVRVLGTVRRQVLLPWYSYVRNPRAQLSEVPTPFWDTAPPADAAEQAKALLDRGQAFSALAKGIEDLRLQGIDADRRRLADQYRIPYTRIRRIPKPAATTPAPAPPAPPPPQEAEAA